MKTPYKILLIALVSILLHTGCEEWLDVTPDSSLTKEDLLKTEEGFLDVLHGVYIGFVDDQLYGQELTYGFMDVLAQYYDNIPSTPQHIYNNAAKYDYQDALVKSGIIDKIWVNMYNNIANCNVILDNIDTDPSIFTENNYDRVKAEALALRAFMHFDLLRMYAPAYSESTKNETGIPYVDKFTNVKIPFSSIDEVCQRISQDLLIAKELLREFDVMGPVDESIQSYPEYKISNRKGWINYYAITALMARLSLYMDKKVEALQYVEEFTTDHAGTKIKWGSQGNFNYNFYIWERIFSVYISVSPYMLTKVEKYFDVETADEKNILKVSLDRTFELYETASGGSSDWRYLDWLSKTDDNYIIKFNTLSGIPIIKLAEIYLIAAECTKDTDPVKSLEYLNAIRLNRGLPDLLATDDLTEEIHKEYAKEFLGEGQLFYYYKRLGYEYIPYWGDAVDNTVYVFPLPDTEI